MKRFLTLLALVAISFCSYAYDFQEGGICYNITSSTEKTVSVTWNARSVLRTYSGIVVIPLDVTHNGTTYAVTSIENSAFSGSSRLTSVTIPNSVTSIGDGAFIGCSGLTSVTIPNSVTSIGYEVFFGCSGLTSVTIPNSVTSIGEDAFSGCSGLKSITIPNSVTSIERYAFYGCAGLIFVAVDCADETDFAKYLSRTDIYSVFHTEGLRYKEHKLLLNGVEQKDVVIPHSVKSIGKSAFTRCSSLTSVTIPNSVTSIGESAFSGCSGLTSITIPNSVTRIGDSAFSDCSGLTSVTIPNSVTSIERYAFEGCSNMRSIHSNNPTPPTVGSDAFKGIKTMHCVIYVPIGAREDYAFANGWGDFYNIVEEDVSAIDSNTMPNAHSTDSSLYTISGTKVGISNLPTGIYIKNGKKVLVK